MFLCTGSILLRAVPQEPDIPPHRSHPHEDNLSSPYHPPKLWVGYFYENTQPALRSLLGAPCSPLGPRKDWKSAESQPSLFHGWSIGVAVLRQPLFLAEHQAEALGRGEQQVRRMVELALAFGGARVPGAEADTHGSGVSVNFLQRGLEVLG